MTNFSATLKDTRTPDCKPQKTCQTYYLHVPVLEPYPSHQCRPPPPTHPTHTHTQMTNSTYQPDSSVSLHCQLILTICIITLSHLFHPFFSHFHIVELISSQIPTSIEKSHDAVALAPHDNKMIDH